MALVTDRTESDALLGNEKGLYSYTDLNRVETAVSEIVEQFPPLGVSEQLTVKTDWGLPGDFSAAEWPVASQMARYLGNVAKIKRIFIISSALPNTMENLTWHGANSTKTVDLSDEQLKMMVDIAERKFVNNINLTSQAPVITVQGQNTGNTEADRQSLADLLGDLIMERVQSGSVVAVN